MLATAALLALAPPLQVLVVDPPAEVAFERRFDPPAPVSDVAAACAVANGVLYATGYAGGADNSEALVVAWDVATDTVLWQAQLGGAGSGATTFEGRGLLLAPDGGPVLVRGASRPTPDGRRRPFVAAFDRASGALLWTRALPPVHPPSAAPSFDETATSFALSPTGDRLYVAHGAEPDLPPNFPFQGPVEVARLTTLEVASGAPLAATDFGFLSGLRDLVLSADGTRLFALGSEDDTSNPGIDNGRTRVECLDPTSGASLWTTPIEVGIPLFTGLREGVLDPSGQTLFVVGGGLDEQVAALSTADGSIQWTLGQPGLELFEVALDGGALFVAGTQGGALFSARLATDGTPDWVQPGAADLVPRDLVVVDGRPVVASEVVLSPFGSEARLDGLDPASGTGLWSVVEPSGSESSYRSFPGALAALDADSVAVVGGFWDDLEAQEFSLQARRVTDGVLEVERRLNTLIDGDALPRLAELSPDGARLYVAGESRALAPLGRSFLLALDAGTGELVWDTDLQVADLSDTFVNALLVDPDGGSIYAGGEAADGLSHFLSAHAAATGAELWRFEADDLPGSNSEFVEALAASAHSPVLVAMTYTGAVQRLRGFDAATGQVLWTRDMASGNLSHGQILRFSPDGSVVHALTTTAGTFLAPTFLLVETYDAATGQPLWGNVYAEASPELPWQSGYVVDAELSDDGATLYVAGRVTLPATFESRTFVRAIDAATGADLWSTYEPALPGLRPLPVGLELAPDGSRLFVGGWEVSLSTADTFQSALAVDPSSGQVLWHTNHRPSFWSEVRDVAVARDGSKLYLIGDFGPPNTPDEAIALTVLDAGTGTALWTGLSDDDGQGRSDGRRALLDPTGERLFAIGNSFGFGGNDVLLSAIELPRLTAFPDSISLGAGGTQSFDLSGGAALGGDLALLLGSLSGTAPGIPLAAGSLPLVPDAYFDLTLSAPNQPPLAGSLGLLSAAGHAEAGFTLPPGSVPALAGATLHHAWVSIDAFGGVTGVSNAVPLELAP